MHLREAVEPVIDTKCGPRIGLQRTWTMTCAEQSPCSKGWYIAPDSQFDRRSLFILDVELARSKLTARAAQYGSATYSLRIGPVVVMDNLLLQRTHCNTHRIKPDKRCCNKSGL